MSYRTDSISFRPNASLLSLLGKQLIRDAGIAVFELVKNSFDADASNVLIELQDITKPDKGYIIVEDDGVGMDWDTVTNIWFVPGTNNRRQISLKKTAIYSRTPLGAKGIGRFAAHKLGNKITLITRSKGKPEVYVEIDWSKFTDDKFLDQVPIKIGERKPEVFLGEQTGTRIRASDFHDDDEWTRGSVRNLYRSIISINSPFEGPEDFRTEIRMKPDLGWIDDLQSPKEILKHALFTADCEIEGDTLSYNYKFIPFERMVDKIEKRETHKSLPIAFSKYARESNVRPKLDVGRIRFRLFIFDRDPTILALSDIGTSNFKKILRYNGGIRVYRDGIRVYDYGELGNDWLDLDARRVNFPSAKISNNIVIGAIELETKKSQSLKEKTNREGFIENKAFRLFKDAILFSVTQIESERYLDKQRMRLIVKKEKKKRPVIDEIEDLRNVLRKRGLLEEFSVYIDKIESSYLDMADRLLTAASSGLGLVVALHELEKGIKELSRAFERTSDLSALKQYVRHLDELISGLSTLIRRSNMRKEKVSSLINQAIFNTTYRLQYHGIEFVNGLEIGDEDFEVVCSRRLIIATLMNLIDNSIYWLDLKKTKNKRIYIGTSRNFKGNAIVFADNGPGIDDPAEMVVQPFWTRKPDGMGLGLYLADEVMKSHGGKLEFPKANQIKIYKRINKAIIALIFKED